ncbi:MULTISPECIES: pyruvate dehydrogenase complex dihydrolipoamide acetyltransferase [Mameliella]|uniref:pyruvate dehydrogenase complex dihydrolipoamide acetyltransferase n=1 Tax=Mameliella TaxID=1434019 RepID=UPI000B52C2EB|nr:MULTISPECIES: pyruvate dehydrogenase complex dihydrolipoamide acetyltransferase [Mameliella]MCR9274503.1 pyruvate dehydrogenase complex dihydrolipoamide acetyltransferase [Paracoccaceae bacterium]OWV63016.1 pyruvate dehydrogenase complex dihydrolipoamide acetyltransferase [Mameliella alba]
MPTEILMPALSPTMEEGTLAKWLVKEGDEVRSGDVIAEIETDKATMEFEAVDEGVIGKILVAEGTAEVKVNTPIAVLLEEGETAGDIADAPPATAPKAQAGAAAEAAPAGGPEQAAPPSPQTSDGTRIFASPLARRIAEQKGLDLAQISGSGPRGRIVKADVEAATASPAPVAKPTVAAAPQTTTVPVSGGASADAVLKTYADRPHQEIPLDGMRRTIAARLTEAKQTIPHFYLRRDIRLDALMAFRRQLNDQLAARGVKLSVNDFIIKACANALQQVPAANAVWAGDSILQLEPSDVAVAVAIEGGLFTPVLRDAHQKSLSTLSAEMKDLATRARDRKLAPQEYQGGSFAISNLGMFGIENFDAVINPPHGAILAVGAGVKKAVVGADGQVEVATVMSVTLSVDHRVIDGALGAELLRAIVEGLENPLALLA